MDVDLKKQVLRKLTYGMWVLATGKDDDIEASSVTWLTQMSFAPPLLAVAVKADSRLAAVIERHRAFALHLLDKDQKDLASAFIKPTQVADGKVAGVAYRQGPATGSPLLDGFAAWLEARMVDTVKRGDHTLFIGEVIDVGAANIAAEPFTLAQVGWSYGG